MSSCDPIGVFDSGLGGLTIVKALRQVLPNEPLIYYGDLAHLPYGDKSPELVRGFSLDITDFLLQKPVKAVVIACNTASAAAGEAVRERCGDLPVIDVVRPAVDLALRLSDRKRIGIIGTKTTIRSGIYRQTIFDRNPEAQVVEKATPLLVPIIEEGWHDGSVSREVIEAYMSDTGFMDIDTLILGCTHYPLIRRQIMDYFQSNHSHKVEVIDSSMAVAGVVQKQLEKAGLIRKDQNDRGEDEFYVSDFTQNFLPSAQRFLGEDVKFEKVVL